MLENTSNNLRQTRSRLQSQERETENWKNTLKGPLSSGLMDEIQYAIGQEMGHLVSERISEFLQDNPEFISIMMERGFHNLDKKVGNEIAAILCGEMFPRAEIHISLEDDYTAYDKQILTRVKFPSFSVNHVASGNMLNSLR